jgi:hypothetical protein
MPGRAGALVAPPGSTAQEHPAGPGGNVPGRVAWVKPAYPAPARTYAAPARAYPAPARTYPAPARTYAAPKPRRHHARPPASDLPPPVGLTPPVAGVVTADVPGWNAMTQSTAQLAVSYVSMATPLAPSWLHSVLRVDAGAEPVIEITPTAPGQPPLTLAQITAGQADPWLAGLRGQIDTMGRPVVVSFAPEANGTWYAWSGDPAGFTAAWRHVRQVIGTNGVTWMWQVSAHNIGDPATADIGAYWPGAGQVDWAGLDGYYYSPGDNFELRFAHSLAEVGSWWAGPVIVAETAVSPATGTMAADVADLFAGVAAHHLYGMVYLNLKPDGGGFYHPDFRLENYPDALAAYVKAVNDPW